MRSSILLLATAAFAASRAYAADELKFGPPPSWVVPQTIPEKSGAAAGAPVALLLNDTQANLESGKTTTFTDVAIKVQNSDGLSAGNIAFMWQPATDSVTVNQLQILRGKQVIDVIGSGQTFAIARRETNLEAATLDGTLTATLQAEGLQVGDIVRLATTTEHADPVLKGHVEGTYAAWNGVPLELGHARISWPTTVDLQYRQSDDLPKPQLSEERGYKTLELRSRSIEPEIPPKGAPARFKVGRLGEFTDYDSWSEVAQLMRPLYEQAAVIPASGPLRAEVESIRKASSNPKQRARKALELVESRIRYVALVMGTGGYVPASAETTWSRRFGDCKAKTVLLLALLHELGIEAEPVLVNSKVGDILPERLPMVSYFDHVLVRASLEGNTYWLDATRTGDGDIDAIPVPGFKWALPLSKDARLVAIAQPPLDRPETETTILVDATKGLYAPAPFSVTQVFRGDAAKALNLLYSKLTPAQMQGAEREFWHTSYDYVTVEDASHTFDPAASEFRLSMKGAAQLPWDDSWWLIPSTTIAFKPDFSRATGKHQDAPVQVDFPSYTVSHVTVVLPSQFKSDRKLPPPVDETQAGVAYIRAASITDGKLKVETSTRALVPEVPYKEAVAAEPRLKSLYDDDVYVRVPADYVVSEADLKGMAARTLGSASEFVSRGNDFLDAGKFDQAIADFTSALRLKPDDIWALANRGLAYVWKQDFAQANKDLAAAEAIDPANAVMLRAKGLSAQMQGSWSKATDYFTQALKHDPGNGFALLHRAQAYQAQSKYDEALADTDLLLRKRPDSAELRLLRANLFWAKGDRENTRKEADALSKLNSSYALVAAARTYDRLGLKQLEAQAFDQALALKPEAFIYVNRAQSRPFSDYAGRLADLDAALNLDPNNAEALAEKAAQFAVRGRLPEALQLYDKAIAQVSEHWGLDVLRAVVLYKLGRRSDADAAFAEARKSATTATRLNNICWVKGTENLLLDSALEECREALKLAPNSAGYKDSLGMVLLRLGKLDESLKAYDEAIGMAHIAASYMGRAMVFARKGDLARADADRAEALKLDPLIEQRFAEYGLKLPPIPQQAASQ